MKYILKHIGGEMPDIDKVTNVVRAHHGSMVDSSMMPKIALVTVEPSEVPSLQADLKGWNVYPEKTYQVPTTKKTVKRH